MKRLTPLVLAGLLLAACGDSIDSNGQAPGGAAGTESDNVTEASDPADAVVVTSGAPAVTEPVVTEPVVTEPVVTEPVVTEPPVTEPVVEAPDTAAPQPTSSVVQFFGGGDVPGQAWIPLGAWDGSAWVTQDFDDEGNQIPLPQPGIASVAASSLDLPDGADAVITGLALGGLQEYCVGNETGPLIELPRDIPDSASANGYDAIAVTADWELQPRPVRQVGLEAPIYREVGTALFDGTVATNGEGVVVQAVRVDLDGNGIEEVLVTYERQSDTDFGAEGDFTGIYARYPSADGSVVDELVTSYVSGDPVDFPTPGRFTLAAVADLNGDGTMEVMVRDRFWESGGMQVFALVDGRLASVAGGGCGV
ncbi:MAG: hypothetical protein AB8G14_08560 [Ilumatobacter sp.]